MASYRIEWKGSARNELRKLVGTESAYRVRVGDYRVVYSIDLHLACFRA